MRRGEGTDRHLGLGSQCLHSRVRVMNERDYSGSPGAGAGTELHGTIKWCNPEKGFGFVSPAAGSQDVFLHISALKQAGLQDAPEGSSIHCEVGQGRKGIKVLRVISLDASTTTTAPPRPRLPSGPRPEQSRSGKACVSTCSYRCSPYH